MSRNYELLRRVNRTENIPGARETGSAGTVDSPSIAQQAREEIVRLVYRLFFSAGSDSRRSVLFCGVTRGTGTSWVCSGAAQILGTSKRSRVCIVDANLRHPSVHQYFQVPKEIGLAEALQDDLPLLNMAKRIMGTHLSVITSGSSTADPHLLFASEHVGPRFLELQNEFDQVLIDAPAADSWADAGLLARFVDGVVLVLEANATHREAARKVKEAFEAGQAKILGGVLNKRTFPVPSVVYRRL